MIVSIRIFPHYIIVSVQHWQPRRFHGTEAEKIKCNAESAESVTDESDTEESDTKEREESGTEESDTATQQVQQPPS